MNNAIYRISWKLVTTESLYWVRNFLLVFHSNTRGSAPSNRIWNNTTLRSSKQQIWLRTALCEGWCRRMALRNRKSCMPETTTTTVTMYLSVTISEIHCSLVITDFVCLHSEVHVIMKWALSAGLCARITCISSEAVTACGWWWWWKGKKKGVH